MTIILCRVHWHEGQAVTRCMLPVDVPHDHARRPCSVLTCRDRQVPSPPTS